MSKYQIFYNGHFHTMNKEQPSASAVACCDGKILAVGAYNDFGQLLDDADMIDMEDRFVFPGFIDTYSAPAITAFEMAASTEDGFTQNDRDIWMKDCRDYLCDKGVATLCLHESVPGGANFPQRTLTDIKYRTDFEIDVEDDYYDNILDSPQTSFLLFSPVSDDSQSVHDAIDRLTCKAAQNLGRSDIGVTAPDRAADFTSFDIDPFANNMHTFQRIHASTIILAGSLIYDASAEAESELYDLLASQAF